MTVLAWLAALAGLLLIAAAAELAARWWIRHRSHYYVLPPGLRLRLRPDPAVFPQLETDVRFDVNADGERGDDVPRGVASRILVLGGSQPEGYLLDQRTTWPGALQRLLNRADALARMRTPRVHVGSIARSGVGSEGMAVILERVLPRYPRLHAIVILVGASDVLRWLEAGAPPAPPPPLQTSELFRRHPEVRFGWRPRSLALAEVARRLHVRWLRPVQSQDRACKWIGRARAMRANAREVRTALPDPRPMLGHFDVHFRRALRIAKTRADRVIVVRQPWFTPSTPEEAALMWHGSVGKAWQDEVVTFYSLDVLSQLMTLLDARASAIAAELDVEQLDVNPLLDRGLDVYYDTFHATPAGARIVAEAVAATISRRHRQGAEPARTVCVAGAGAFDLRQIAS